MPVRQLSIALLATLMVIVTTASHSIAEDKPKNEVSKLIDDLGADSYATRQRATEKLQRMGLEAFDQLHDAQFHADNEISMAARFLVSSLLVSWSKETDPQEVREALLEYGAQAESERGSRIDMLAELPERKGLVALARLTRFETSLRLSRRAALAVMQQPMSDDADERQRNAGAILEVLADNDRQGAEWLRAYADDLAKGAYSADNWRKLIEAQRNEIDTAASSEATRPSVLELVRVCATRAAQAGHEEEALRLASESIDLIAPTSRDLIDACSWAIDNNLYPFVLTLHAQHERMFNTQPILLYGAAEAKQHAGDASGAETLAQQASEIRPLPKTEEEKAKQQPKDIEESALAHREIASSLQERGLFTWAEREYRQIVDVMELDSRTSALTRRDLAEMLGELQRHDDVVAVLKPLVERVENDAKMQQQLNMMLVPINLIRSTLDYHAALALIAKGENDKARPLLHSAYQNYPDNVDVLISMYRLKGDDAWQTEVAKLVQRAIRTAENDIKSAQLQAGLRGDIVLAQQYNQYSWLVCNTEGDYQKALQYSLKSLELEMDYAKLDTCARCYYAVGDLESAVRMQKRAVKLSPHSPPLLRQLEEFETKLAEKQSAAESDNQTAEQAKRDD